MPYIKNEDREKFKYVLSEAVAVLQNNGCSEVKSGELNYVISSMVWSLFDSKPSYTNGNMLVGVLECVKQEFLRRRLNDYENEKIKENGDI